MDLAAKANPGILAPQPVLEVGRRHAIRRQQQPESDLGGAGQQPLDGGAIAAAESLVGVDVEDPLAASGVERDVARLGEVAAPAVVDHASAVPFRDLDRVIDRAGIDNDDLIDDVADRGQAFRQGPETRRER